MFKPSSSDTLSRQPWQKDTILCLPHSVSGPFSHGSLEDLVDQPVHSFIQQVLMGGCQLQRLRAEDKAWLLGARKGQQN
jgi:hypothetical protein